MSSLARLVAVVILCAVPPAAQAVDRGCPYSDRIAPGLMPTISADGRVIGFVTGAALDLSDANGAAEVYVVDRATGIAQRISVGQPGDWSSRLAIQPPALSADGRYVAFATRARLTSADKTSEPDVYRYDRITHRAQLVSVGSDGAQGKDAGNPSISADGNVVAFDWIPSRGAIRQAWVRDIAARDTATVTEWPIASPGRGSDPSISADGTLVAFAGNPLWNDEGQHRDVDSIFVYDRVQHDIFQFAKRDWREQQRVPDISANGRIVSYGNAGTTGGLIDRGPGTERPVPALDPYEPRCLPPTRSAYRSAVLDDHPVRYLRFGEQPGTSRTHDERRPAPEFWMGGTTTAASALREDANRSLQLDGRQFVGLSAFPFAGRDSFSLEAWIRPRHLDARTRRVFSNESATAGYLVGVRASTIHFERHALGRHTTISAAIAPHRWTHVVATFDGAQQVMRLYLDGVRVGALRSTLLVPSIADFDRHLAIGALRDHWRFFSGEIDEAAIYDRALDPGRVVAHAARPVGAAQRPAPPARPHGGFAGAEAGWRRHRQVPRGVPAVAPTDGGPASDRRAPVTPLRLESAHDGPYRTGRNVRSFRITRALLALSRCTRGPDACDCSPHGACAAQHHPARDQQHTAQPSTAARHHRDRAAGHVHAPRRGNGSTTHQCRPNVPG